MANKRSGFVAIVGRPNVGKSSLLNALMGQKIAITSHQPQTTRHQIQGIQTKGDTQIIYVDTPGMHLGQKKALNRLMNKAARAALMDVDVVLWVVEAGRFTDEDALVQECIQSLKCPILLIINKIDALKDKRDLLPYIAKVSQKMPFFDIIPVSAVKKEQIELLEDKIVSLMKEDVFYYPEDQSMNHSVAFHLSELLREALIRVLVDELPHALSVEIEAFSLDKDQYQIAAVIWVERESQKPIVIGEKGERLKAIGTQARLNMKAYLKKPVFLQTWVKVKTQWTDDLAALRKMGYDHESDPNV